MFVDDVTPFEQRKLWLLNGAHSLLAYAGAVRGARDGGRGDGRRRAAAAWSSSGGTTCAPHLALPADGGRGLPGGAARTGSPTRGSGTSSPRSPTDGSQKLPVRVLPVLRAERAAGRLPEPVVAVLAAWVPHLRGAGTPVQRRPRRRAPRAGGRLPDAVPRVLAALDPALADDAELVAAVRAEVPRS